MSGPTHRRTGVITAAIFASMLLGWHAVVVAFRPPDFLLPSPLAVGREFLAWPELLAFHTWVTLLESALGLAAAIAVAVPLAIAVVYSRALSATIYPILVLLQSVPKIAFAPLFLIWMGIGMSSKVLVAMLVAFFPIVIDIATGLRAVESEMLELTRVAAGHSHPGVRAGAATLRHAVLLQRAQGGGDSGGHRRRDRRVRGQR